MLVMVIEQGIVRSWGRPDISKHVCDGDGQNMHNFMNMNISSSKSGDVVPSNSNTHVQTQRSIDIDMYDVNDWKKYKIGPWSLKLQHQRQQRGQGGDGDGDGSEGKVSGV